MELVSRHSHARNRTAVVTGGAGFIGSHLVDALLARGDRVVVVDDLSSGRRGSVAPGALFVAADVADADAMRRLSLRVGPATWFHLAARAEEDRSRPAPLAEASTTVLGTIAVLEAARATGSKVVFASSGVAVYGGRAAWPTTEAAAAEPASTSGAAKLAAEAYVGTCARLHAMDHVVLRLATVYGPRQDPRGEGSVVAAFADRLHSGQPATIFGTGEQVRDLVYVTDAVAALLAAAASEGGRGVARRFNVGTGVATSVAQLWTTMQRLAGVEAATTWSPRRPGDVETSVLDPSRARRELGVALAAPLEVGLSATLAGGGLHGARRAIPA